ncbi:MAG: amino acid ABC transporter substrate-binding protein [Caldibacillus sp.]
MKRLFLVFVAIMLIPLVSACANKEAASGDGEKLVIGIDDAFPPMGFRDENNEIVGFDIDLAKAVSEKMGVEFVFQPIDWSTKEAELNSGRIDLIWNGYTITPEREEKVLFTKPYLANAQVIATLIDSDIQSLEDLEGKNIGIQAQSSALDAFNASPIKDIVGSVTEFKDNVLALTDLKAGRIDAVVIDEVVINYLMTQEEGTYRVLAETLAPEKYGVGVKKGNEELLVRLQKAIDEAIADGTAAEISIKWFGEDKILK